MWCRESATLPKPAALRFLLTVLSPFQLPPPRGVGRGRVLHMLVAYEWCILEWIHQPVSGVSMEEWPWSTGFVGHGPEEAEAICASVFLCVWCRSILPPQGRALVTSSLLIFILSFSGNYSCPCHQPATAEEAAVNTF